MLYATGEILLVMVGILLALQVNNWNELKQKKDVEVKLLKELAQNLKTDKASFSSGIDHNNKVVYSREIIIQAIESELPWNDSLIHHFNLFMQAEGFPVTKMGYNSLENWGTMNLSNDSIRNQIAKFYQEDISGLERAYEIFRDGYSGEYYNQLGVLIDWNIDFENLEFRPFNYDEFIKHKEFGRRERMIKTLILQYTRNAESCLISITNLISSIEKEIKRLEGN
jgi:hypothetical protein